MKSRTGIPSQSLMAIVVALGTSMAINGPINGHRWAFVKDDPIVRSKIRSKRRLDLKAAVLVEKQFEYSNFLLGHRCI